MRFLAVFTALNIIIECVGITVAYALTSGPSQPEVQSFEPAGTTQMVDVFTGDFTYNIPLFELPGPNGGYPFNLAYHGGVGMDQEASWVGLGWSLNPGAITRQMRGLPDDFQGDEIVKKMDMKPDKTIGGTVTADFEIFGFERKDKEGNVITDDNGDPKQFNNLLGGNVSISAYDNTYRGIGFSFGPAVNFQQKLGSAASISTSTNLNFDSQGGLDYGFNTALGVQKKLGKSYWDFNLGLGINSRTGLSGLSLNMAKVSNDVYDFYDTKSFGETRTQQFRINYISTAFPLVGGNHTPQVTVPYKGLSLNLELKTGGSFWGIFGNLGLQGFYNEQSIRDRNKNQSFPAYGYMYLHGSDDGSMAENGIMDFNREKDSPLKGSLPNLAVPQASFDMFSVSGQGVAGLFRAYRSDIGILRDNKTKSFTNSVSAGYDAGAAKFGGNLGFTAGIVESGGMWDNSNENISNTFSFRNGEKDTPDFEPYYFGGFGEMTIEDNNEFDRVGKEAPIETTILNKGLNVMASRLAYKKDDNTYKTATSGKRTTRKKRSAITQDINNKFLERENAPKIFDLSQHISGFSTISEAEIEAEKIRGFGTGAYVKRKNHIGAFVSTDPQGTRYVYALPVYNTKQVECQFSIDGGSLTNCTKTTNNFNPNQEEFYKIEGTDEYYSKTEIPQYTYAHLLTAVLGPDYVDVKGDGVTEDDLGYWVKFTYEKIADTDNPYKWRAPFNHVNFNQGSETKLSDDKGSYMYGEKEIYYLKKVETKSHIAEFNLNKDTEYIRKDAQGAVGELQAVSAGLAQKRLESITLKSRSSNNTIIKKIDFKYDETYPLCTGVPNSSDGSGKLTLNEVIFTYGNNTRGAETPYKFEYYQKKDTQGNILSFYDDSKVDRWGNFNTHNPVNADKNCKVTFPYVWQGDEYTYEERVADISSWNLSKITLPSGGTILVDYEPDDYGYVQDKVAMQMTSIVGGNGEEANSINANGEIDQSRNRIYFNLEEPIPSSMSESDRKKELAKYLDSTGQLYFKLYTKLTRNNWGYISGYARIGTNSECKVGKLEADGSYKTAYVEVSRFNGNYHPFSVAGWQHIRGVEPELMVSTPNTNGLKKDDLPGIVNAIKGLGNAFGNFTQIFKSYFSFANGKGWANEIDLDRSFIRLNSPDKKKYGGGHRVKQITMQDNWSFGSDLQSSYGQYYKYTTNEKEEEISSGVATYEPLIGGDEIALRTSRSYSEKFIAKSNNSYYVEYPFNESYYPAPSVGYSKVTVMSLAEAKRKGEDVLHDTNIPNDVDYGTTGVTVHEYYTAKDFPVISKFSLINPVPHRRVYPIPTIGSYTEDYFTASQGYVVELNDMHGKVMQVSNYAKTEEMDIEATSPVSYIRYHYKSTPLGDSRLDNSKRKLKNNVEVLIDDTYGRINPNSPPQKELPQIEEDKYTLGLSQETYIDMRQTKDAFVEAGVNVNFDLVFLLFGFVPIPGVVPNASAARKITRTIVTNKIIHRSGILEKIEAYDRGSNIITENLLWDNLTGEVVLTSVQNNFGNPIYSYNIPAHLKYEGMSAAYKNTGLQFSANVAALDNPNTDKLYRSVGGEAWLNYMYPGDQLIVSSAGEVKGTAIFKGVENGKALFYADKTLTDDTGEPLDFFLYRSGRRNQLSASVANITALANPTDVSNRSNCETCDYNVEVTGPNE